MVVVVVMVRIQTNEEDRVLVSCFTTRFSLYSSVYAFILAASSVSCIKSEKNVIASEFESVQTPLYTF